MVHDIGGPAFFERYGISNFFDGEGSPGVVGNIATDAKSIRDMIRTFFLNKKRWCSIKRLAFIRYYGKICFDPCFICLMLIY